MPDRHFTSEGRLITGLLLAFFAIAALAAVDLASDVAEGITLWHALTEGTVVLLGFVGAALIARRLVRLSREARGQAAQLGERLRASKREAEHWRREAQDVLRGLGVAIDQQFERWQLTSAEKEVALLLLKGLSHKEVAHVRSVTEATARQQAGAVYKKAGVAGRSDLAAFFLEDLMLPAAQR